MGYSVFESCEALESIEISDLVKSIERDAFKNCGKLSMIKIGFNVEISDYAFQGTPGNFKGDYNNNNTNNKSGGTYLKIGNKWIK